MSDSKSLNLDVFIFTQKHESAAKRIKAMEESKGLGVVIYSVLNCYLMCSLSAVEQVLPALEGFSRVEDYAGYAHFESETVKDSELKERIQSMGRPVQTEKWKSALLVGIAVPKQE